MDLLRFMGVMTLAGVLVYVIAVLQPDLYIINKATAEHTCLLVSSLGFHCVPGEDGGPYFFTPCINEGGSFHGCLSRICGFKQYVVNECSAYVAIIALLGLIVAVPDVPWREKIKGMALGLILVYGMNIVRMTTIAIAVQRFSCQVFDIFHLILWREALLLWTLAIWILWWKTTRR